MITRAKPKRNELLDLPGIAEFPGFFTTNTTTTLPAPNLAEVNSEPNPEETEKNFQNDLDSLPVILDADITPAKTNRTGNRRVLRLSQESREILKLLKQNLRLTYDQQIQFLVQLVLYHELLPENTGLQIQKRIRELRRFSRETATAANSETNHRPEHLRLCRPLPLESLLSALEERCAQLQAEIETLTRAIDARTELQLTGLQTENDYPDEDQFPALN